MAARVWDDSAQVRRVVLPLHGMGLSCSRLAVSEDGAVVPVQGRLHDWLCGVLIDFPLRAVFVVHLVEGEGLHNFLLLVLLRAFYRYLATLAIDLHDFLPLVLRLLRAQRPAPHDHLDALGVLRLHHRASLDSVLQVPSSRRRLLTFRPAAFRAGRPLAFDFSRSRPLGLPPSPPWLSRAPQATIVCPAVSPLAPSADDLFF